MLVKKCFHFSGRVRPLVARLKLKRQVQGTTASLADERRSQVNVWLFVQKKGGPWPGPRGDRARYMLMTSGFVDDDVAAQASEQEVAGAGSCNRKRAMRCGRDCVCGDEVK